MFNCRFCLQNPSGVCVNYISDTEESNKLLSDLFLCTQIIPNIERNSSYPVCNHCINDLHIANTFRLKCIKAQQNFSKSSLQVASQCSDKKKCLLDRLIEEFETKDSNIADGNIDEDPTSQHSEKISDTISNADNTFECDICTKVLKSSQSLVQHKSLMHERRKHIGKVSGFGISRRYHCNECDYSTPHSQTLVNHVRRHSGERPYACHCGKRFTQSSALQAHQKTHSSFAQYTCTVCGKQLKLAHSLKRHMRCHEDVSFPCPHCQKQLKSRESLKQHMQRHENIRDYNCEECGKTFITSSELINHKKKHNVGKIMKCNFCDYETNMKKSLVIHLKRHTGIKTKKCSLCEAAFYTGSELRAHQSVHTRAKPYHCPHCTQHFTHSSSVNKHVRTVHGKQFKWSNRWQANTNSV